jgi:hypothetical protein
MLTQFMIYGVDGKKQVSRASSVPLRLHVKLSSMGASTPMSQGELSCKQCNIETSATYKNMSYSVVRSYCIFFLFENKKDYIRASCASSSYLQGIPPDQSCTRHTRATDKKGCLLATSGFCMCS